MSKKTVHFQFTHSETAFRIINGRTVSDEEWREKLMAAAKEAAELEFQAQLRGAGGTEIPQGLLKVVK